MEVSKKLLTLRRKSKILVIKLSLSGIMYQNFLNTVISKTGPQEVEVENYDPDWSIWGLYSKRLISQLSDGDIILFVDQKKNIIYGTLFYKENYIIDCNASLAFWGSKKYQYIFGFTDMVQAAEEELRKRFIKGTLGWDDDRNSAKLLSAPENVLIRNRYPKIFSELLDRKFGKINLSQCQFGRKPIEYSNSYLYLVWPERYRNQNVDIYKFGKTKQFDPYDRIKSYGEDCEVIQIWEFDQNVLDQLEIDVLTKLREVFGDPVRGREYFQGSRLVMHAFCEGYLVKNKETTDQLLTIYNILKSK